MAREPRFQLAVVSNASHWDLFACGELDLSSGRELVDAAAVLASYRVPVVEIDLGGVTFMDTAGWRAVGAALDRLSEVGTVAVVSRRSPAVEHLEGLFPVAATAR
jgi:anti-anti-sigma regulatory factor